MRASVLRPCDRDAWAVYVFTDTYKGTQLLCSDGVWRPVPEYASLEAPPLSPTVILTGLEQHREKMNGVPLHKALMRKLHLTQGAVSYLVHEIVRREIERAMESGRAKA